MKIYTKTGDDGDTGLFGGGRVAKSDAIVQAYGSVDETNACLGVARSQELSLKIEDLLRQIQRDLFVLGAELASTPTARARQSFQQLQQSDVERLEQAIDATTEQLPDLAHFILPAGSRAAAALHLARTVCRRAERDVVNAHRQAPVRAELLRYLNRLSDLLFVLARDANQTANVADEPWVGRSDG